MIGKMSRDESRPGEFNKFGGEAGISKGFPASELFF
jgi:hypothetical protein